MVQYIINPDSGRKIKVGGPTYNKLIKEGKIFHEFTDGIILGVGAGDITYQLRH